MTARDQVSAVANGVCSGCVEATRERGRLLLVDFGSATAAFPPSAVRDFEAERDLRPRVGVAAAFAASADFDATRHLPASVPLAATPPVLPVLWTCDRTRTP